MLKQGRASKLKSRSPWPTVVMAGLILFAIYYAVQSGAVGRVAALLAPVPGNYPERMAGVLLDTPECATYRADILKYRGKPQSEAATRAIDRALRDGIAAGCKRSDIE